MDSVRLRCPRDGLILAWPLITAIIMCRLGITVRRGERKETILEYISLDDHNYGVLEFESISLDGHRWSFELELLQWVGRTNLFKFVGICGTRCH